MKSEVNTRVCVCVCVKDYKGQDCKNKELHSLKMELGLQTKNINGTMTQTYHLELIDLSCLVISCYTTLMVANVLMAYRKRRQNSCWTCCCAMRLSTTRWQLSTTGPWCFAPCHSFPWNSVICLLRSPPHGSCGEKPCWLIRCYWYAQLNTVFTHQSQQLMSITSMAHCCGRTPKFWYFHWPVKIWNVFLCPRL